MSVEFIQKASGPTPREAGPTSAVLASHSRSGDAEGAFPDMDADADLERVAVMDTLCMACERDGVTRLLLTRIPYFRDIVVMSFECPHCFARNAEVQPANDLAPKGCRVSLRVDPGGDAAAARVDLNRQVIKSETCAIRVPEADFEIPANTKRGDINTVEGVLSNVADSLEAGQANRELSDPETAAKIEVVIARFRAFAAGEEAFTLQLDDPAGNSFLENPAAPSPDPRVQSKFYERTREQTLELGYAVEENKAEMEEQQRKVIRGEEAAKKLQELFPNGMRGGAAAGAGEARGVTVAPQLVDSLDTYFNVTDRLAVLQGQCIGCSHDCETRMCVTEVPHFKEVVLLVTQCEACGYKDAEVKPTGSVSKLGRRITLKVTSVDDLKRDLLKSDTASIEIPELELELQSGTLGGKYTTLEGMLDDIREALATANPFSLGDSSEAGQRSRMDAFVGRLENLVHVHEPWTFILDDPLGNCFVHSEQGEGDPCLHVHRYERSFQQNEDLGLNDINVDDYMTAEQKAELERELAREAAEQAEEAKHATTPSAAPVDPKEAQRERLAQLMKSKIGGLIPVTHQEDDEGATGAAHGAVVQPKPAAASSSADASSSSASEESKQ